MGCNTNEVSMSNVAEDIEVTPRFTARGRVTTAGWPAQPIRGKRLFSPSIAVAGEARGPHRALPECATRVVVLQIDPDGPTSGGSIRPGRRELSEHLLWLRDGS